MNKKIFFSRSLFSQLFLNLKEIFEIFLSFFTNDLNKFIKTQTSIDQLSLPLWTLNRSIRFSAIEEFLCILGLIADHVSGLNCSFSTCLEKKPNL